MATRFQLARAAWPVLLGAARERRTMTYGELASTLGYRSGRVMRFPLSVIQDFCLEKGLPPLTSIVMNQDTGRPGPGFTAWSGPLEEAHRRAFGFDWSGIEAPFPNGEPRLTVPGSASESFEVPDQDVIVNGRGPYQSAFRNVLMRRFAGRCALCDTTDQAFLVASHIVPWAADPKRRLDPANGILFFRTHDAAFESGLIVVREDCRIELRQDHLNSAGEDLSRFLRRSTATTLRCPTRAARPDVECLKIRLGMCEA